MLLESSFSNFSLKPGLKNKNNKFLTYNFNTLTNAKAFTYVFAILKLFQYQLYEKQNGQIHKVYTDA